MTKIAVIGGGPKGAAIATKAQALKDAGYTDSPEVVIYEQTNVAANWTGQTGYTDGKQLLCTIAERDIGFPYDSTTFPQVGTFPAAASIMFSRFSWHAFCIREGLDPGTYADWVLDGRSPPCHGDFARYLQFVCRESNTTVLNLEVSEIDHDGTRWSVTTRGTGAPPSYYDGVVITGTGAPLPGLPESANPRVFNGQTFWTSWPTIRNLLTQDDEPSVMIIGAGGTAAAIANFFIRLDLEKVKLVIVGREPALFARVANKLQDRLYTDEDAWAELSDQAKQAYTQRLNRGVVWVQVLESINKTNVFYRSYDVRRFVPSSAPVLPGHDPGIYAELHDPLSAFDRIRGAAYAELGQPPPAPRFPPRAHVLESATVFIDARGFDRWWFVDAFFQNSALNPQFAVPSRFSIASNIGSALDLGAGFPERLHIPALAERQGPAAANLMALGWMSDRVLRSYVTPILGTP